MTALEFPVVLPGTKIGQKLDRPVEFLDKMVSPYTRNMEFYNGRLQGRYGLTQLFSTVLPGAPVLTKATLDLTKFGGLRTEVLATKTDIVSIDFTNSRYTFLTPTYTTGTIEVQAGTPTILRGTGTLWLTNAKAGDYFKLGSGSVHTGSTWYTVASVDSDTQITATASMPTTGAGSAYVLRQTFTGGATDFFDWVQFEDTNLGQILIVTNGVDKPHYWTGTGQFVIFPTAYLHTSMTAAKYVGVFSGRLLMAWVVQGGINQPQRLVGWNPFDISLPDEDAFPIDFVDEPTEIKGIGTFSGYHLVFKETNAQIGRFVGGDVILDYEPSYQCKGVRSAWSVIINNDFISYYGVDKKFHRWNLLQDDIISEDSFPEAVQFDPNHDEFVQGFDVARKNQWRWFCPYGSTSTHNYVYVYDYIYAVGIPWVYTETDACCCMGTYLRTSDQYFDDSSLASTYFDGMSGFFDDSSLLDNGEVLIYGGYDGIVRLADNGSNDDGTSYTRLLRIKRLNFDMPDFVKRLWRQQWWLEVGLTGSVTIKMMLDDSVNYEATTNSISIVATGDEDVVKRNITWDMRAQDFQPEISATIHFAVLGFINYVFKKRSTGRG